MSEEFINSFGKGLYYLNQIKSNEEGVCFRVIGKIKVNRIVVSSDSKEDDEQIIINEEFDKIINNDLDKYYFYLNNYNLILSPTTTTTSGSTCGEWFNKQKQKQNNVEEMIRNYETIEIIKSVTINSSNESLIAPIFKNHKGISILNIYELPIDILIICENKLKLNEIYFLIFEKLKLQIETIKQCYLTFYKNEKQFLPQPFHYYQNNWEFILTIVWPNNKDDSQLKIVRENIHKTLNLPLTKPFFRRLDSFKFTIEKEEINSVGDGNLLNPHLEIKSNGIKDGKQTLVKGNYIYYHYMQDGFNDNGWGCAYRSLQTIFSWFKLQSFTSNQVPTHRKIQETLVEIGDKNHKFIGSQEWIGSMEISFCLNKLLGVESRILNVARGSDLGEKVRELEYHFETEGTPVMIGGGAYAYTILGVDFNESTGEVNYLVLDPHYVGQDYIKTVISKGWCGWKSASFWNQTSYYNLCLPLRNNII